MRKFFSPLPDGGAPIYNQELNGVLQKEFWDIIENVMGSILYGSSPNVIVSGGEITNNGDGTLNITSGIAYVNNGVDTVNNFMRFDAYTNVTYPAYLTTKTVNVEQIQFADAVDRDYISEYDAQVVGSMPATEYITLDFPLDNQIYLQNILAKQSILSLIVDDLNAQRRSRPILVANVDTAGAIDVSFALEGTWTSTKLTTGIYEIRQDGSLPLETKVLITPSEVTTANGVTASWEQNTGTAKMYSAIDGNHIDKGFTIVIYPI